MDCRLAQLVQRPDCRGPSKSCCRWIPNCGDCPRCIDGWANVSDGLPRSTDVLTTTAMSTPFLHSGYLRRSIYGSRRSFSQSCGRWTVANPCGTVLPSPATFAQPQPFATVPVVGNPSTTLGEPFSPTNSAGNFEQWSQLCPGPPTRPAKVNVDQRFAGQAPCPADLGTE
jgi:hypothetical protein